MAPSRPSRSPRARFKDERRKLELDLFHRQQKLIYEATDGYTDTFRKYERRYRRSVRGFEGPATFRELVRRTQKARVVLVGDYHTHPQAQRAFLRILRAQAGGDPALVVALEMIAASQQKTVDRFLSGRMSEATFLERIDYAERWPFGSFDSVRPIFDLARQRGWRVVAIDADDPDASSLADRDELAAAHVAELLEIPGARVFTLIGELHLAPGHLPRAVQRACRANTGRLVDLVRVHQSPDTIWFQCAEQGLTDEHDVMRLEAGAYALLTASPVVFQQSFLTWLEVSEEGDPDTPTFGPNTGEKNVHHALKVIGQTLKLPSHQAIAEVRVVGPADLSFFGELAQSKAFKKKELDAIRRHILSAESCYIPLAQMIYLATLSVNHAAEEAAHMLRHLCSEEEIDEPKALVDAFYFRVMHEAVAFFGSKLVNPKRKCHHAPDLAKVVETGEEPYATAAKLVLDHKRIERGESVPHLSAVFHAPAGLFNAVSHLLGYILGDQLYYALSRDVIGPEEARALFHEPFAEDGAAMLMYFELAHRLADIKPPRRAS